MAVFDVRSHPHPLPSLGAELLPRRRCSATQQPPIWEVHRLCAPPYDGFALLAAHRCACRPALIPTPDEFPMNLEWPYAFMTFFETSCTL